VLKCPQIEKDINIAMKTHQIRHKFGNSLIFKNADEWRTERLLVNKGFSREAFKSYYPKFVELTEKLIGKFANLPEQDIDTAYWFNKYTADLLGKTIFNYDFNLLDCDENKYYSAYKTAVNEGGVLHTGLVTFFPFIDHIPFPTTNHLKQQIDVMISLFQKIIDDHKQAEIKHGDILDSLVSLPAEQLSSNSLMANLYLFFAAGHDTTAAALSLSVAELADKQDIQERIYQDIISKYGQEVPSFESIYQDSPVSLETFMEENLRVHPPAELIPTRIASADITYKDQVIPKGSLIILNLRTIHRHPDHWVDPDKFDPDRFLPESKKGRHKFAYAPFSLGQRKCIGNVFSEIEQRLFLVRLLQRYKIVPSKDIKSKSLDLPMLMGQAVGYYIRLEKR